MKYTVSIVASLALAAVGTLPAAEGIEELAGEAGDVGEAVDTLEAPEVTPEAPAAREPLPPIGTIETSRGKSYRDIGVLNVDPHGLTFSHADGIAKVAFEELPAELRDRFDYDREEAKRFVEEHKMEVKAAEPSPRMLEVSQRLTGANFYNYGGGGGYHGGYAGLFPNFAFGHHDDFFPHFPNFPPSGRFHRRLGDDDFRFFTRFGSPVPPPVTNVLPILPQPQIIPRNFAPPARALPRVNQTLHLNR